MTLKPGTLLAAHPDLSDEYFANSVVLLTENHTRGTIGIVINTPHMHTLRQVLEARSWPTGDALYQGGPVNQSALLLLHSSEWYSANTMTVTPTLSISSDTHMLDKTQEGNTPRQFRFIAGMSGWAPGQLASEIAQGRWLTTPATDDLIWSDDGKQQWTRTIERCAELAVQMYF